MGRTTVVIAAIVAASVVVSASLASAAPRTIRLSERQTSFHVSGGDHEPGPGDTITIEGNLFRGGHRVGHDRVRCNAERRCRAALSFDGGKLVGRGVQSGQAFTVRIVSGSGSFAQARGTIDVALRRAGASYTVHLR